MEQANHRNGIEPAELALQPHWQGWLMLLLKSIVFSLGISLMLMILVVATATAASAQSLSPANPASPAQSNTQIAPQSARAQPLPAALETLPRGATIPEGAALLFQTDHGPVAAPLQSTDVLMQVNGHLVRTRVAQTFHNPSDQWLHAIYRFPLADSSAVDSLLMRVGDQLIRGEIKPREAARRTFERARRNGKRASLVSQTRPNDFNARIANISPGGSISIEIEFQQVLSLQTDGWALRFPTVVAPKYGDDNDPDPSNAQKLVRVGYPMQDDDLARPLDNSNAKTATLLEPDTRANRIRLDIQINAGMGISVPRSLTHQVDVTEIDDASGTYRVQLAVADIANRDFELQWEPAPGEKPGASVQFEKFDNQWFGLAVVSPPDPTRVEAARQPRELIFVVDTSGSMHGESLDQAVEALQTGLRKLGRVDRFNIIRFSSNHEALWGESQPASDINLDTASRFLDRLQADGGTEMHGALKRALRPAVPAGYMSQVVFVTDGAVGGEQKLYNTIENLLGKRRLFTVGIGSAPNDYFMKKAAAAGRGSFTMISATGQVQQRMTRLFDQLAYPMLTELRLRDVNGELIVMDSPIRDLYAGQPVVHTFRTNSRPAALFLEGNQGKRPWQQEINTVDTTHSGIHKLWARDALDDFAARIRRADLQPAQRDALRSGATQLAMKHGLVSRYTSLVAVAHQPARPADSPATTRSVPRQLPKGWDAKKTLGVTTGAASGTLANGNAGLWLQLFTGSLLLLLALAVSVAFLMRAERLFNPERQQ